MHRLEVPDVRGVMQRRAAEHLVAGDEVRLFICCISMCYLLTLHRFVYFLFSRLEESLLVTTGVCSGGGRGDPPETLNGLTRNPLSSTR